MSSRVRIEIDSGGIEDVLNSSAVRSETKRLADSIAETVRSQTGSLVGASVDVAEYTAQGGRLIGKRPGFTVRIAHPGALAFEARHGTLTRAAGGL